MENVVVRNANVSDAHQIAKIHVETWQCAYRDQIPDSYLNSLSIQKRTETWKDQLSNPKEKTYTFVAEKDSVIVGWCTAGISRDKDTARNIGEVYGIYVDAQHIGKGIGTKLMEQALNILRKEKYDKATLWVLTTNKNSRIFYEKKGWINTEKIKVDKREGFDLHETRYIINL